MAQQCRDLAASYGVDIVSGFAERDAATGIFYNAAAAYSLIGYIAANYWKISAETR